MFLKSRNIEKIQMAVRSKCPSSYSTLKTSIAARIQKPIGGLLSLSAKKMVVFAGSIAMVTRIGELTQLPLYYHSLKDKQKQLITFMRSSPAIVTTSALSSGINIPNLSIVLHLPISIHGLMEFSQESRRQSNSPSQVRRSPVDNRE
jgi:hypothetical protein